jgi:hypothetical protein
VPGLPIHHKRVISSAAARPPGGRVAESRDLAVILRETDTRSLDFARDGSVAGRNQNARSLGCADFRFAANHASLGMTGLRWSIFCYHHRRVISSAATRPPGGRVAESRGPCVSDARHEQNARSLDCARFSLCYKSRFARDDRGRRIPVGGEVAPLRIHLLYQPHFLFTPPAF